MSNPFPKHLGSEPIEDTWVPATQKQQDYIEILRNDLGFDLHRRNAHIKSIVGKGAFQNELFALSKSEASQVIQKFKEWKEQKRTSD